MIAKEFLQSLIDRGYDHYFGVPDSLLSGLSKSLELDFSEKTQHIITQNEGAAVGMAIGHYLGSGKPGIVYLQNSGIGNIINPITSLATKDVYNIPIIFLVGWRGQPGVKDEPQHTFQGRITIQQLELLEIEYQIVNEKNLPKLDLLEERIAQNKQFAYVFQKNFFKKDNRSLEKRSDYKNRKDFIEKIYSIYCNDGIFISTTGKTSRELYFINKSSNKNAKIFYTIGGMGHASSIAAGISLSRKKNKTILLDGDGSLLMHMGILPIIGSQPLENFYHFVFNNSSHESVGNQPTVGSQLDLEAISKGSNYKDYFKFDDIDKLEQFLTSNYSKKGPVLIEIVINQKSDPQLGRPHESPSQNKDIFMKLMTDET